MRKPAAITLSLLLLSACGSTSNGSHNSASGNEKWIPANTMEPPHLNIVHVIDQQGPNEIIIDGETHDASAVRHRFSEISKNEILAYIDFRVDCDDKSSAVSKTKMMIEESGACEENFCICGGLMQDEPPSVQ